MKILITGGTGFIGRAIAENVLRSGSSLRILDNDSRGSISKLNHIKNEFEYISGDVRNLDIVERATKGIDRVIHMAYINGTEFFYSRPYDVLEVAVKGISNILDSHKTNNFSELIIASTSETYQSADKIPTPENIPLVVPDVLNPRFSYGGGKIATELLAVNYALQKDIKVKIFRPHNVYGPDMGNEHVIPQLVRRVLNEVRTGKSNILLKIQGTGNESRSFCYIDDFISGLNVVMSDKANLGIYNIGVNDEISILNLVKSIGKILNVNITIQQTELQKGSPLRRCPDITKISELGFTKKWDLLGGLEKTINWYSSN